MRPQGSEQMTDCPSCRAGTLREATRTLRRTVGGREFSREVPVLVCEACGERLTSSVDQAAFERQIADEVLASGLHTPDAVTWVLDGYGLGPDVVGATWPEVRVWEDGLAQVPARVWPALVAAVEAQRAGRLAPTGS